MSYCDDSTAVALNLKRIAAAVADAPDVDPGKIRSAREALSRGVLEINRERIADKLIDFDTALDRH